ncbi:MAG: AtpZ/AtpI family protein [Pseudomonadota bacterium]
MPDEDEAPPASPSSLEDFGRRLEEKRAAVAERDAPQRTTASQTGAAMKIVSDLVVGVVVGAGLGWMFDEVFGTSPWFLVAFFLLGFAGGVSNVIRSVNALQAGEKGGDER